MKAPERTELEQLVYTISERTGRYLEHQGLLVRDMDNSPWRGAITPGRRGKGANRKVSDGVEERTRRLPAGLP